jgi:uncharacterized protein (UPF0261 family)
MVQRNFLPALGTFETLSHYFQYIDDLADSVGASTPMFDVAADLSRQGLQRGLAQHDVAAIFEVIDSLCAGTDSRKAMQASGGASVR